MTSEKVAKKRIRGFFDEWSKKSSELISLSEIKDVIASYRPHSVKFDESVDISIKLGTDPKKTDQVVKTNVTLPHGSGKKVSVLVMAAGEDAKKAKEIGATHIGLDDMIEKVIAGELVPGKDFTSCVATPDAMLALSKSKAARILGVAGMMPNTKAGTVAKDIAPILKEVMSGRIEIKSDRNGFIKLSVGKLSSSDKDITENMVAVYLAVKGAKPASLKGNLFDAIRVSTTMMCFSFRIRLADFYANS